MSSRKLRGSMAHGETHTLKGFHHWVGKSKATRKLAARIERHQIKMALRKVDTNDPDA